MTETLTPRVGLRQYSAGTDGFSRNDYNEDNAAIEALMAIDAQGTRAARPAPSIRGRFYTVVGDGNVALNGTVYRDNGTSWEVVGARLEDAQFRPSVAAAVAVTITGLASQTADLLQWRSSIGTLLGQITPAGAMVVNPNGNSFGGAPASNASLTAKATAATVIGFVARGATGQTANIQEWQSDGGTIFSRVDSAGKAWFKGLQSAAGLSVVGNTDFVGNLNVTGTADFKSLTVQSSATSSSALIAKGIAGQTADIFQVLDNASAELLAVQADGLTTMQRLGINGSSAGSRLHIASGGANDIGLRLKGFLGQIGNLAEWVDNNDTLLGRIDAAGRVQTPAVHFSGFVAPNHTAPPSQYPTGVTHASITTQTGYPKATGLLWTVNNDPTHCKQTFFDFSTDRAWTRTYSGGGWTPFREITSGQCAAKMVATVTVNIPDGGLIPYAFDAVRYETHPGMCNVTNGIETITVPAGEGGRYRCQAQIVHDANTGGTLSYRSCGIQINNVSKNRFAMRPDPGSNSIWTPTPVEWTGYLNAGDTVRVETFQFTGSATLGLPVPGVADSCFLQIEKVGPPLT